MTSPPAKNTPPPLRAQRVSRAHLIARLAETPIPPLTLVVAPAGFGKTTFIGEWTGALSCPVTWVTATPRDNDPELFWSHIFDALEMVHPQFQLGTLQPRYRVSISPDQHPLRLLNTFEALDTHSVIVIDDYHLITNPAIHDHMVFLIDNLPSTAHLALGSRVNPPWPLARLRARAQLVEIRADDLRFTTEEAAVFLNDIMGLTLSAEQVAGLETRTEGWIAGLQLAALSLQGRDDIGQALDEIAGDNRFIRDFLMEEVFARQPEDIQHFLLHTAIPERLSAGLCNALTRRDDGQMILEQLERENLFLIPLDMSGFWYRYHQLFRDFLRTRLVRVQPECFAALNRNASIWYAENDLHMEAFEHALEAHDPGYLAKLLETHLAYVAQLNTNDKKRLLAALPEPMIQKRPYLALMHALVLIDLDQHSAAGRWIQHAITAVERDPAETPDPVLHGLLDLLRAEILAHQHAYDQAIDVIQMGMRTLENAPNEFAFLRNWGLFCLGEYYNVTHQFEAARFTLTEIVTQNPVADHVVLVQSALCQRALIEMQSCDLHEAAASCQEAIHLGLTIDGSDSTPLVGRPYIYMAHILYEWNRLDESLTMAQMGMECLERWETYFYTEAHLRIACVQQVMGHHADAEAAIQHAMVHAEHALLHAREKGRRASVSIIEQLINWTRQVRAHVWLLANNLDALLHFVDQHTFAFDQQHSYLIEPRLYLLQGHPEQTLTIVDRLLRDLPVLDRQPQRFVSLVALRAAAQFAQETRSAALDTLGRALEKSAPSGLVRTFLDLGSPMIALLKYAALHAPDKTHAEQAARILAQHTTPYSGESISDSAPDSLPAGPGMALTPRDQDILRLIAAGLSNQEIAEELVLTVGTVKWYANSIYSKLGVRNRVEAAERARALNLV